MAKHIDWRSWSPVRYLPIQMLSPPFRSPARREGGFTARRVAHSTRRWIRAISWATIPSSGRASMNHETIVRPLLFMGACGKLCAVLIAIVLFSGGRLSGVLAAAISRDLLFVILWFRYLTFGKPYKDD